MLKLTIPEQHLEFFDEATGEFKYINTYRDVTLELEHSLLSLSKWEEKTHKPFIKTENKTAEEILEYIKCMTMNEIEEENSAVYDLLSKEDLIKIKDYIDDPMTAAWFTKDGKQQTINNSRETITSEIIYYWMIALGIPSEYEKWHLNKLITLIKVVSIKTNPKKEKINKREAARERAALNAKRRAMYNTKG